MKLPILICSYRTLIIRVQNDFEVVHRLAGHADGIFCLAWSPDNKRLVTAADAVLKVWDTQVGHRNSSCKSNADCSAVKDRILLTYATRARVHHHGSRMASRWPVFHLCRHGRKIVLLGLLGKTSELRR